MKTITIRGLLRGSRERLGIRRVFFLPAGRKLGPACPLCLSATEVRSVKRMPRGSLMVLSGENMVSLSHSRSRQVFLERLRAGDFSCIALADGQEPPAFLRCFCEKYPVALFSSSYDGSYLLSRLAGLIREKIYHTVVIHGVLVNLYGRGLLITGKAGVGKTTCGLALAERGHVWIADDVIEVVKTRGKLYGRGYGLSSRVLGLRGRGIVDIGAVPSILRFMPESPLDLWCELTKESVKPGMAGQRRLMEVPLTFSPFPVCPESEDVPAFIEKWVKTYIAGKELT